MSSSSNVESARDLIGVGAEAGQRLDDARFDLLCSDGCHVFSFQWLVVIMRPGHRRR